MSELWEALSLELGAAFKNQYGDSSGEVFARWCKELSCFSRAELQRGFAKFKESDRDYMSLKIFRNLCKLSPEDLGLPSEEAAFDAVIFGRWEELPEAFQVVLSRERYGLRQLGGDAARRRFKERYNALVKRIAGGEVIQKPDYKNIPAPKTNPSGTIHTKEKYNGPKGSEAIKNLLGMIGKK